MTLAVNRYGPNLLIDCEPGRTLDRLAQFDAVLAPEFPEIIEMIPGANTILIRHVGGSFTSDRIARAVRQLPEPPPTVAAAVSITLDVRYDGPDLPTLAAAAQLSAEEVAQLHTASEYRVAFCGFAPGFGYLTGLDRRLVVPRRDSPRTHVPAGSLAVASEYTTVYPTDSPGGWHLIGHCETLLFDPNRNPPAMLRPGMTVRFRRLG